MKIRNISRVNNLFNLKILAISLTIVIITIAHYLTPPQLPMLHALYRRLYYIPIIFAAINFGMKGGLITSLTVSVFYIPHILGTWGKIPLQMYEAITEILLYNIIGYVTAHLVEIQKRTQKEKEKLLYKIRQSEKYITLGEMASVLTHELKTPIATISGAIEIIETEVKLPDDKKKFCNIINKEIMRLNNLVNNTLSIFKSEKINRRNINLTNFIDDLKEIILLLPGIDKIIFKIINTSNVNEIFIDADLFKEIFINLVNNSIAAIKDKGKIEIRISDEENSIIFSIKDNGEGIKKEMIKEIFTPFYTTKKKGVGLGLVIVKRIIEMHNGSIECKSRLEKGTEFIIKLPIKEEQILYEAHNFIS